MKDIIKCMQQPSNKTSDCFGSLSCKLEVYVGNYFVSGAWGLDEIEIEIVYYDEKVEKDDCVNLIKDNIIAYVIYDDDDKTYAFVLEKILEKFISDTIEYGLTYIPVTDFDSEEFCIDINNNVPELFKNVTWIQDDFMNDEKIEFDFEAFYQIDSGIRYINPNHFSINKLMPFLY